MSVSGKRLHLLITKQRQVKKQNTLAALLTVFTFFVAISLPSLLIATVTAANITSRSLTLQTGTTPSDVNSDSIDDGGSTPGGTANHLFTFTLPNGSTVNSISFEYCTTADIDIGGTCTTPTGLDTTGASLGATSGVAAGFDTITATTNGKPYLSSSGGVTTDGNSSTIRLDDIVNPDDTNCGGDPNCTFYVRITTYTSNNATTGATDAGTVAAATNTQIQLTGTMPESLIFCTGGTISTTSGIPDCSTATSGDITFPQLFDPTSTTSTTSQMAASTNAGSGYSITVEGPTLTSGSNTIPAIGGTATTSSIGTGQFGINLVDNTTPNVGSNIAPASNGSNYKANAKANFNTADSFAFDDTGTNAIAASDNGGTAGPTDSQIYTASYIVNVSGSQPAGTYTTTLTYICTPTF
ncbi:MAG TPA: hypothetical protein VFK11_04875 [Candidatus Saccharimonadales bacterium]|nr:hypothetical protein [Candidatus Saccharimonadales bacterium]